MADKLSVTIKAIIINMQKQMIYMNKLTCGQLFELYINTLDRYDIELICKTDLEIEDSIFDGFFGGIISYFYK